jgi:hypothetical protein
VVWPIPILRQSAGRKDEAIKPLEPEFGKRETRGDGVLSFFEAIGQQMKSANAHVAQLVERVLGKDEVTSSTLVMGSSPLGVSNQEAIHKSRRQHG